MTVAIAPASSVFPSSFVHPQIIASCCLFSTRTSSHIDKAAAASNSYSGTTHKLMLGLILQTQHTHESTYLFSTCSAHMHAHKYVKQPHKLVHDYIWKNIFYCTEYGEQNKMWRMIASILVYIVRENEAVIYSACVRCKGYCTTYYLIYCSH